MFPWKLVNKNRPQLDRPGGQLAISGGRSAYLINAGGALLPSAGEGLLLSSCEVWLHDSRNCSCHAPRPFTIFRNLLKFKSIASVMPSNHLILCHPLLLLPSIFPSIRVFSGQWARCIKRLRVTTRRRIYNADQWRALRSEQGKIYTTVQTSWSQTCRSSQSNNTGKWHLGQAEHPAPPTRAQNAGRSRKARSGAGPTP